MMLKYFFGEQNEPFILFIYIYVCVYVANDKTTDDLETVGADSSTAMEFT